MQNQQVLIQNIQEDEFSVGLELLKSCFNFTVNNEQYDTLKTHFNSEARYRVFVDDKLRTLPFTSSTNIAGGVSKVSSYP